MKKTTMFLVVAVLTAPLLTQCIVVDENGKTSIPAANVSGSAAASQSVYDLGYQKGLQDGRGGDSRNPQRYAGSYPYGESDVFNMGYEKGYNQGIR